MTTELAMLASSIVTVASSSCFGGKPTVCSRYVLVAPGRDASMNARISPTVWVVLKRATMRVPSANLNWIEVDGEAASNERPLLVFAVVVVVVVVVTVVVGSGMESSEDPLPRTLPTPRNAAWRFTGS